MRHAWSSWEMRSRPLWKRPSEYRQRTISASTMFYRRTATFTRRVFLGLTYTDDLILVEITFIAGRTRDARLMLLRAINERVVSAMGILPDDLAIMVYETAGENISFGRGEAQRAHVGASS